MNLGQALKKVREAKGLSQKEVALSCKMDTAQYRSLMEKLSMVDTLAKDEQQAIFKMIDLAVSNKKMKDNLTQLIAQ
jgi:transcriptional regulator with XRE-family HTH domain